jgi:hypothetical protein
MWKASSNSGQREPNVGAAKTIVSYLNSLKSNLFTATEWADRFNLYGVSTRDPTEEKSLQRCLRCHFSPVSVPSK